METGERKKRNFEGRSGKKCDFVPSWETNVDPLPCCKQWIEKQRCWRTASNSVRMATEVLRDTVTESAESTSQEEEEMEQ